MGAGTLWRAGDPQVVGPPDSAVHLGEPVSQWFAAIMLPLRPIAGWGRPSTLSVRPVVKTWLN